MWTYWSTLICVARSWLFDKIVKNYIVRCWKAREGVVGVLTVKGGVLAREFAPGLELRPPTLKVAVDVPNGALGFLRACIPPVEGYSRGDGLASIIDGVIFDVRAAVCGYPDARFSRYDILQEAEAAFVYFLVSSGVSVNVLSVALPGMARDFDFAYIAD